MDWPVLKAEYKAEGNAPSAPRIGCQVCSYMAGIWFIQRGEQPAHCIVACESNAAALGGASLARCRCAFWPSRCGLSKGDGDKGRRARLALHLNLAAALRLSKYTIARTACEYVCMIQGNAAPKARYRLAKAMEGQGDGRGDQSARRLMETDSTTPMLKLLNRCASDGQRTAPQPHRYRRASAMSRRGRGLGEDEQRRAVEGCLEINQDLDAEMGS